MLESFEYDVKCWLPNAPEQHDFAVLNFDPMNGITIKITGNLASNTHNVYPIIQCSTLGGMKFTLFHNQASRTQIGRELKEHITTYASLYILEGIHSDMEVKFAQFVVSYAHLEDWVDLRTMDIGYSDDSIASPTISYRKSEPLKSKTDNGELLVYPTHSESSNIRPELIKFQTDWKVNFKLNDSRTLPDFLRGTERVFRDFLTLGLDNVTYHTSITGYSDEFPIQFPNNETGRLPIQVYYSQEDRITNRKINPAFIIFRRQDIHDDFDKYVNNYYEIVEQYKPIFDLYFGVMNNTKMYLIHAFLSYTQALEVYHRQSTGTDKHLKDALLDILKLIKAPLPGSIGTSVEDLAEELKNTRHYLTHYDKKYLKRIDLSYDNLLKLVSTMQLMLQQCLFTDMGFDAELITKFLRRSYSKQVGIYNHELYT